MVLLVSHDPNVMAKCRDPELLLDVGWIVVDRPARKVVAQYLSLLDVTVPPYAHRLAVGVF